MTNSSRFITAAATVTLISITLSLFLCNDGYKSSDDDVESEVIPLVGALGPESLAFHPVTGDGPYTGVSDGRIIKWNPTLRRWSDFAVTSPDRYTQNTLTYPCFIIQRCILSSLGYTNETQVSTMHIFGTAG